MCVHMSTSVCMCASVCAWVCVNEGWRLKKKNKSRKDGSFFLNKRQSLALLGCSLVWIYWIHVHVVCVCALLSLQYVWGFLKWGFANLLLEDPLEPLPLTQQINPPSCFTFIGFHVALWRHYADPYPSCVTVYSWKSFSIHTHDHTHREKNHTCTPTSMTNLKVQSLILILRRNSHQKCPILVRMFR